MSQKRWVLPISICAVSLLLAAAVASSGLAPIFILTAGASLIWAAASVLLARKGRYDLDALRNFHEKEEIRAIERDMDSPADADSVLCLGCGELYSSRFPACPHCSAKR